MDHQHIDHKNGHNNTLNIVCVRFNVNFILSASFQITRHRIKRNFLQFRNDLSSFNLILASCYLGSSFTIKYVRSIFGSINQSVHLAKSGANIALVSCSILKMYRIQ